MIIMRRFVPDRQNYQKTLIKTITAIIIVKTKENYAKNHRQGGHHLPTLSRPKAH